MLIGQSVEHRPIVAHRAGDPAPLVRVLVVGDVHGNERAGERIVARLRHMRTPRGVRLWLVRTANPDGVAAGTRQDARGVDLNRNFPYRWRPGPRGTYYPGPRRASEPETRALMRLVRRVRPDLAIYYHQAMHIVVRTPAADLRLQRAYGRRTGLPLRPVPGLHGTATSWENDAVRSGSAFVVELGPGRADAGLHARAVLALARSLRDQQSPDTSSAASVRQRSLPPPPSVWSAPAPPFVRSSPGPAASTSSPSSPASVSSPVSP
jgi:protein MpaA